MAAQAQDMSHMQHMQKDTGAKKPMKHDHAAMMKNMQHDTTHKMGMMTSQFSLDLPMNRDGSGTSWVPDETPMYMYMIHGKKWMHMVHGSVFCAITNRICLTKGSRGGSQVDAPNWLMYMAQRKVGKNGLFAINTMFSFDPFTVGAGGYPLLYQTGRIV
jgi:hypothetical protein